MSAEVIHERLSGITLADILNPAVFGYAAITAWSYILLLSTVVHYSTRNSITHLNSVSAWNMVGMAALLFLVAVFPRRFRKMIAHTAMRVAVPLLISFVTFMLVLVQADFFEQPWCRIFSTLSGVTSAIILLGWGEVYGTMSPTLSTASSGLSFVLAALAYALTVVLPHPAAVAITMMLPIVSAWLLWRVSHVWKKVEAPARIETRSKSRFFLRALLSVGIIGLAESTMRHVFLNVNPVLNVEVYPWLLLAASAIGATIVCICVFTDKTAGYALAYRVVLFLLAFLYLVVPILRSTEPVSDMLLLTCFCATVMFIWVIMSCTSNIYGYPPMLVFGFGWGSFTIGQLIGNFGGSVIASFVDLTGDGYSLIALICASITLFSYFFIFREGDLVFISGDEAEGAESHSQPFRERCAAVAAKYALTDKESEVMALVAKGRSVSRICEEMLISQGTANTHLNHIYRKLGVHSRQEMLDLIDLKDDADQPRRAE